MPPDFSGQNLRGRSFKGQDLSGANFSGVDIRGANFTGTILKDANFSHAKAGLQRRWVIFLVSVSCLLLVISGFCSFMAGNFTAGAIFHGSIISPENPIAGTIIGWVCLIVLILLYLVIMCQGIPAAFGALAGGVAFSVVLILAAPALAGVMAFNIGGALAGTLIGAVTFTLAFAVGGVGAVAFTIGGAGIVAFTQLRYFSFTLTVAFTFFPAYIAWRAIKGDEKQALIRNMAVAFAATGGTSFRGANLTDANFTGATLKSTDFRKAILTRTCFRKTKKLDCVRPGNTYLQDKELRQLLITGNASGKSFKNRNLQQLNLFQANLAYANLIGTNFYQSSLREANLEGSLLVRAQLESTDLTDAILTGACIEDWLVTKTTKLYGVKCKYIFMKFFKGDKRDQMPLKGEFKNDDFVTFVQSIVDTIKLYHERDVNPNLALYVLQSLSEDYQCTLEIVKLEKRGENGAILEVKIPGNFNEEKLKQTYYEKYSRCFKLHMSDPKKELKPSTNIEKITMYKGIVIGGDVSDSTIADTIYNQGDTIMSEGSKQQFTNYLQGSQFAGGLVNADKVEAGQIGGDINNYTPQQKQNLAEAAAEIQQLLQQLEQTNPTTTTSEKMTVVAKAVDKIENNLTLKARVVGALQSGGTEAFKELVDHPLVNILMASIEGWQSAES